MECTAPIVKINLRLQCFVTIVMHTYLLVNETILVVNMIAASAAAKNHDKELLFKNFPPFTDWISAVDSTQKFSRY